MVPISRSPWIATSHTIEHFAKEGVVEHAGAALGLAVQRGGWRAERRPEAPPARWLTAATLWEGRLSELQRLRHHRWPGGVIPSGQRDARPLPIGQFMASHRRHMASAPI